MLTGSDYLWAQEMTVYVASEMTRCKGMLEVQCYQMKDSPEKDYDIFVSSIDGFTFDEGYEYKLLVQKSYYENSPPNSAPYYSLKKIVSKTLPKDTLVIANKKSTCEDTKIFDCLLYKQKNEKEWHNLYGKIKGFKYKEGYDYELLVTKKLNLNMGAGKTYEYTLIKTLSKKPTMIISDKNWALLNGQKYVLTAFDIEGILTRDVGQTRAFITFDLNENRVNGNDGCNSFFGHVEFNKSKITFGGLGSTDMACPNNKVWEYLPKLLNKIDRYTVKDNTLKFYSGKKQILEYVLQEESEEIDNRKFSLTSISENGAWRSVNDTKAYITFNKAESKVYGNDGCNTFSGNMILSGTKISFSDFVSTKMACDNDRLDITIYDNLKKINNFKISNGNLKLYKDSAPLIEYRLIMEDVLPDKK
jgi:heat shock protein HslJ